MNKSRSWDNSEQLPQAQSPLFDLLQICCTENAQQIYKENLQQVVQAAARLIRTANVCNITPFK